MTEAVSTAVKFKVGNTYIPERAKEHTFIISKNINGRLPSDEPLAVLLGGGSASGKSTYVEQLYSPLLDEAVLIDADEMKKEIKEYEEFLHHLDEDIAQSAAILVHTESSDLAMALWDTCIKLNLSYIYVGTMSYKPIYTDRLIRMKEQNYSIEGLYIDVDLAVCLERSKIRENQTGRAVPIDALKASNRNSAIVFLELKSLFDRVQMYNNSSKGNINLNPFYERFVPFKGLFENGKVHNIDELMLFHKKATSDFYLLVDIQ